MQYLICLFFEPFEFLNNSSDAALTISDVYGHTHNSQVTNGYVNYSLILKVMCIFSFYNSAEKLWKINDLTEM